MPEPQAQEPQGLSESDFAQQIKSKYPQYKDWNDKELASAMIEKYPQYKSWLSIAEKKPQLAGRTRDWIDKSLDLLPSAMGIAGAAMGSGLGSIPLAAVGAAGGEGIRQTVEALRGRPDNEPQRTTGEAVKGIAKSAAGFEGALGAVPIAKVAWKVIPQAGRAGKALQSVMGAAQHEPVNPTTFMPSLTRVQELADRGGVMPGPVGKLIDRITSPTGGPLTYREARDFASNISRLSADEYGKLTPVIAREVTTLRAEFNRAIADAAGAVGKKAEHVAALKEYAKAMRLRGMLDSVVKGAKKTLPYGVGAGALGGGSYWLTSTLKKQFFGE